MQYLIQAFGLNDVNTLQMLKAVKKRNLPYVCVGMVPFTHEVTGLDDINPDMGSVCYGSVQLAEAISKLDIKPGAMYGPGWFDPRSWRGKRDDLLNEDQITITVAELRKLWIDKEMFVKSVQDKKLTGMVIEPCKEDKDMFIQTACNMNGDELLVISPAQNLKREWRFFVVDDKIVTGAVYRPLVDKINKEPIPEQVLQAAGEAVKKWMPNDDVVIDIGELKSGELKVIEFNCLNSSGFYNSDVGKIVDALETKYGNRTRSTST